MMRKFAGPLLFVLSLMLLAPAVSIVEAQYTTNPFLLPDGTAAAPSLRSSSAPTSGVNFDTGTVGISVSGVTQFNFLGGGYITSYANIRPGSSGVFDLGLSPSVALVKWRTLYLSHSIEGSNVMALTAGAATTFVTVAIPQTALVNFASGKVHWTVRASDATDIQTLEGTSAFNCHNKAGTEACAAIVTALNTAVSASAGGSADDLACTITAVTGLVDSIGLAANCTTTEMTETSFSISYRLDMPQANTVAPGT